MNIFDSVHFLRRRRHAGRQSTADNCEVIREAAWRRYWKIPQAGAIEIYSALTLSSSTSIMMYWLIPRIGDFHRQHPELRLPFDMNHGSFDAVRDRIGFAIRITMIEPPPDVAVRELGVERIGLVCSREYLREAKIASMSDIAQAKRLSPVSRPRAWAKWSEAASYAGPELATQQAFDHF